MKGAQRGTQPPACLVSGTHTCNGAGSACQRIFAPEERQAKRFFDLLEAKDYKGAYALWGCTDAKPCRDYAMPEFMKDWGPSQGPFRGVDVLDAESCGSGVIVEVEAGPGGDKKLWVERETHLLGFPPFERCPQGNRIHDWWRTIRFRLRGRAISPAGS